MSTTIGGFSGSSTDESVEIVETECLSFFDPAAIFSEAVPACTTSLTERSSTIDTGDGLLGFWIVRSDGLPLLPRLACLTRFESPS
jgi:hypothetical protein